MDEAVQRKDDKGRFIPGNNGGPGRPKGARNKLGELFIEHLMNDWEQHGPAAIVEVRETKPDAYLKVVASILPKELNVKVSELDDLTDDQLARQYASIAATLVAAGFDLGAGVGTPQSPEQAGGISTVQ